MADDYIFLEAATQDEKLREALEQGTDANGRPILRNVVDVRQSSGALDVSAEEVDVDLASDSLAGNLDVDLASVSAGTLAVEQQTPVGVEDSTGTQIDPIQPPEYAPSRTDVADGEAVRLRSTEKGDVSIAPLHHGDDSIEARLPTLSATTTATGAGSAAQILATGGRTQVSIGYDTSGAATISVEVSDDGSKWFDRTDDVIPSQPGSATKRAETFQTGFRYVRAYADSSLNELLISAKGL